MLQLIDTLKKELKLTRNEIISFVITISAGILMYYQMPDNWLTNPDTVWNSIYFRVGHGGEKSNGRILQILVDKLRMNMITPVLTTVLCIFLLALVAILTARIFSIRGIVGQVLIGQVLLFVPCTSSSLTYYYCAESFMLALLFVILGIYILQKYSNIYCNIASIVLFVASMYLYQAYICVVFTVAVILLIYTVLENKKSWKDALTVFMKYVLTSGIAVIVYVVTLKLLQIVLHISMRTDRGFAFTDLFGKQGLIALIKEAYFNFYQYFIGNLLLNNSFGDRNIINILVFTLGIVLVIYNIRKKRLWKNPFSMGIVIIGLILLPLAAESITVMSPAVDKYGTTGIIMIPTMAFLYIAVIAISNIEIEDDKIQIRVGASYLIITFFVWNSIVFTNLCINSMKLNLNKTETVANMMLEKIVEQYGYSKGEKLLVAGCMEDGNFPSLYGWPMDVIKGTSASYGFMWDTYSGNENCWIEFLKQYKGVLYEACDYEVYKIIIETEEYKEMPLFPQEGSVGMFDDIIVVKMSNVELE